MKLFKNLIVSLVVFSFVFSPYVSLAQTLDTTLTPGDRHPQVSTLQKILNRIGQKVTEIGKETTYYGSLTSSAIKALQCKYNIVCSGTPETTGFGRVGPRTLALINSLKNAFNVNPYSQVGAGIAVTDGLLYSYSFDGNTTDSKGGNNGVSNGSPTYNTGKIGQAITLDGVDDYVGTDATKSATLNGLSAVTLSYWIKPTSLVGNPIARWGTNRQFMQTFLSNKMRFYWRIGGAGSAGSTLDHVSSGNISTSAWNHIVVVYNNPTSKIYINGVLDSSENGVGGTLNTDIADALSFGKVTTSSGSTFFNGSIDDVNIYSRALSDSEITNLYSLGGDSAPTPTPSPTPTPAPAGSYTLTVNKSGSGTVTGTGISCGSDCTENVTSGASVSLTASPSAGSTFTGWSGACTGASTCTVSMTANKNVTATFTGSSLTPSAVVPAGTAPIGATSYYVSPTGSDTNAGTESQPLKTITKAASLARAGTTVYVLAGNYPEHVITKAGGTSDSARIKFKAVGKAIMQGFGIIHPYITVEGFDITGFASTYDAHIKVSGDVQKNRVDPKQPGTLISKGDNCQILNNIIHDGAQLVAGIDIVKRYGHAPNNCLIKGNRLSSLRYRFLGTAGLNHRIEENVFEWLNSRDYMLVFGGNHVFKRNIFWKGNTIASTGNHPDWIQFFNNNGEESYGHLFEENYIEGLEEGVQLGQINSGGGLDNPFYNPDTRDITFRRNVIANVGNNFNISVPGMTFDHNTFYRLAFSQTGIGLGGNLTRGESSRGLITNNVFVGGGIQTRNDVGFYSFGGAVYTPEAIIAHVIKDDSDAGYDLAAVIHKDLRTRGYVNSNGGLEPAGKAITNISQFIISDAYAEYKPLLYENLIKTQQLDAKLKSTSRADYNFVANTAAMGYSAKPGLPSSPSKCPEGLFSAFAFCEDHGVNGGDPKFRSITDLLGPDGKIFTLDDGLKPKDITSPLCGNGVAKSDIGAYSCDPNRVFSTGDSGNVGTDPGTSTTPTADTILPTVSVTSPTNGQTVSGNVSLSANASDNIGLSSVQFFVDGLKVGNDDRVAPYLVLLNSATLANGSHVITSVAKDLSSNITTSASVNITTSNPTTYALTINKLGVGSGEVAGTGILCGGDCSEIFSSATTVTLTAGGRSDGVFGGWGGDCSGTLPTCIVDVSSAKKVTATFNVKGTTPPPPPVSTKFILNDKVKVNATNVNTRPNASLTGAASGQHTTGDLGTVVGGPVSADGYIWWNINFDSGADGWVAENFLDKATVTGTTDTVNPTVSISSPTNGQTISSSINLTATASDNVAVAGVQFKVDGINIGAEDVTAPYSVSFNSSTVANGSHIITAVARDAAGNTKTSSNISITTANTTTSNTPVLNLNFESDWTVNGVVSDISGGNNDATCQRSFYGDNDSTKPLINADQCPQRIALATNRVAEFSGSVCRLESDYLGIAKNANIQSLPKGTVSVWVNYNPNSDPDYSIPHTSPNSQHVLDTYLASTIRSWKLSKDGARTTNFSANNDGIDNAVPLIRFPDTDVNSSWHLYTVTWDGTNIQGYYDGVPFSGGKVSQAGYSSFDMGNYLAIGALAHNSPRNTITNNCVNQYSAALAHYGYPSTQSYVFPNAGFLNGKLDDVLIYNKALSDSEVKNMYDSSVSKFPNLPPASSDTTAPTIVFTAPANNSTVSGSTNLTVSTSDNIGVVGVRYLVDGLQVGPEVTSSPFSATWAAMSDGTYTLTAEARDLAGNKKLSSPISVTVKTATVNVAPVLNSIGNKTIAENSTLAFNLSATDGNGDTLTYSATNLPNGATFVGNSFSFKPTFTQDGNYTTTFTVSDGKGLSDTETITITVTNTNRAPVANAGIDQSISLPSNAILSASASTDPDAQSLIYAWSKVSGPGSVSFSSNTAVSPTATFSQAGTYTLRVVVSDGTVSANDTVTVTVLSNPSADDDVDGVLDGVDLCPRSKVGATVNTRGCPVPKITKFTTKPSVTSEDLRAMESIELGTVHGKVSWKKTGTPYSLVKITEDSYEPLDLDTHLNIKAGEISLDSASVPELNKPATLTFFNVTIRNPEILKNGVICTECDLTYSGTTLTFTVPGFSTYTVVSNDDPTVSITSPSSGAELSGETSIRATASDDIGIESVAFYASGNLIGTDTSSPYEVDWNPSSGSYDLTAKALDVGGLEKTSSSVSVTVKKKSSSGGGSSSKSKGTVTANVLASTASTITLPSNATREQLISYLVAKIQELLLEYNRIKAEEGGSTTTTTDTVLKGFQFTTTFGIGANQSEVRYLQRFLNTHGFPVGVGLGSYGKEVDTFGPVTQATLKKYQASVGIEATGYFGQQTRQRVNQTLLSE